MHERWTRGAHLLRVNTVPIIILRSIFGFLGLSFWFLAIAYVDISLATALAITMPIFITILSSLIGKETVGLRRIVAILCGFCGVLVSLLPFKYRGKPAQYALCAEWRIFCRIDIRLHPHAWEM